MQPARKRWRPPAASMACRYDGIRSDTKPATCAILGDAPPEDRAMLGSNPSAVRCGGWQQPYLDTTMPGRDAVAGIVVCGVKCFWGCPSARNAINPLLHLRRQGYCQGYRYPTVAGTVAGLSIDCCSHCYGTVGGTVAPLLAGTVSGYSTRVENAVGDCGGRWGGAADTWRFLLARSEQSCYTLLSTLTQKKWGVYP